MNISRKSWYVRLFFLMSWFNAKALGKKGPLKDPTDVCPLVRMILIWGPLSIALQLLKIAFVIGIVYVIGVIIFGIGSVVASMSFGKIMLMLLGIVLAVVAIIAVVIAAGFAIYGIFRVVRWIRESAFAAWWSKRFPKRVRPERVVVRRPVRMKAPKPPSGFKIFVTWADGQLHGWCSPLTIVD